MHTNCLICLKVCYKLQRLRHSIQSRGRWRTFIWCVILYYCAYIFKSSYNTHKGFCCPGYVYRRKFIPILIDKCFHTITSINTRVILKKFVPYYFKTLSPLWQQTFWHSWILYLLLMMPCSLKVCNFR
jgi:hypothetical protein